MRVKELNRPFALTSFRQVISWTHNEQTLLHD